MLIPSETVDGNLVILEEVLVLLKAYRFELNYEKCQFLKKRNRISRIRNFSAWNNLELHSHGGGKGI